MTKKTALRTATTSENRLMRVCCALVKSTPSTQTNKIDGKKPPAIDLYYLFSIDSPSQEVGSGWMRAMIGTKARTINLRQLDGSIFRALQPMHGTEKGFWNLIRQIQECSPKGTEIIPEKVLRDPKNDLWFLQAGILSAVWEYRVFVTHRFENGVRCFPIVINNEDRLCFNISALWPALEPEDRLGVLVGNDQIADALKLSCLPNMIVQDYFANVRLCPCCLNVYDSSKPRRTPWLNLLQRRDLNR